MCLKRWLSLCLVLLLLVTQGMGVSAVDEVTVLLNGEELVFDVPPQIVNGRTMVPFRGIFEKLGAEVVWCGENKTVTATKNNMEVRLQIGSCVMFVNEQEVSLDVSPMLISGRTLVPLRAAAEGLQARVAWDGAVRTVHIAADTASEFEVFYDAASGLNYWLFTPQNPLPGMPLVVYLHGGSGRGDVALKLTESGFGKWVADGVFEDVPAYILIPQVSAPYKGWSDVKKNFVALLNGVTEKYDVDEKRISLTGHSMGGTGTFDLALSYPSLFYKIAPMSGSVKNMEKAVQLLKDTLVWAFVGSEDRVVPPDSSVELIQRLQAENDRAKITVLRGAGHKAVPEQAYLDKTLNVMGWLID